MKRTLSVCLTVMLAFAASAHAQTARQAIAQGELNLETQAIQILQAAEAAGAETLAPSLYNEAQYRLRSAQDNWNSKTSSIREKSRLSADEAIWAGRAALAKAQWLSTNQAIRQLQNDITRFGGRYDVALTDEPVNIDYGRGLTTKEHIDAAQAAIDQAKAAGAEQIAGNDLKPAQDNVNTARKINSANKQSDAADHLAFDAEMMARRAYYIARSAQSAKYVPGLQIERTNLAQQASAAQAAAERAQREQAERDRAALAAQLATEQANRAAIQTQLEEARRNAELRSETDRNARIQAEQALDDLNRRYQAAIASGNAADVERLRSQVEDQQIALRSIQNREQMNEQSMSTEIESLRNELQTLRQQGSTTSDLLAQRQADLDRREQELQTLKKEREADLARRTELEQQTAASIAAAQRARADAEAQALSLKTQLEQTQQQMASATTELERTKEQLASSELEARRLRMQQAFSQFAQTKNTERGLVVSLSSGILFDTGKSVLKPGAKRMLTRVADQLKGDNTIHVAVEGHTDSVGTTSLNQTLSEKRAAAVRSFLINAGVSEDRITSTGLGEKDPVATNKTAAGRQQNRRVELVITNG